jgi:SGNH domain (fused to AT3 domains)
VLISHRAAVAASSSEADTQVFIKTLDALFATLTQSGKSVMYLLPVPELAIDPRLCGAGLPMGRQLKLDDCEFPLERVRTAQARYRQLLTPIAQKYPAVKVFDTPAALCEDGKCQVIRNGQTGWTDNNHISESASYKLGTHLIRDRP